MNASFRARLERVTVDLPVIGAQRRSLRKHLARRGVGGRIARDAGNRLRVRALDRIDLEFTHGERVGVIGHNGAGKTTLLRVLAGVYAPTGGRLLRRGRVSALLDVEFGIDGHATGYENIVTRGLYLGLTLRQVRARVEEIAEFTELGDFLALPVNTYSSGMRFRLGFATSTSFRPDILLMDEWLSVGDPSFAEKTERRLMRFMGGAGIVVLVSQDPEVIRRVCTSCVLLEAGRVAAFGPVNAVLAESRARARREPANNAPP